MEEAGKETLAGVANIEVPGWEGFLRENIEERVKLNIEFNNFSL